MAAAITLTPNHGPVATSTLVTGTGFAAVDVIDFTYDGAPISAVEGVITAVGGAFTAHIIIPASVQGTHPITATDQSAGTNSKNFTVDSFISISPGTQEIGGAITVTGTGFATVSAVVLKIGGVDVTPGSHTTDATGGFTFAGIIVPTLTAGVQTVDAKDAANNEPTTPLTVSAPTLSLTPNHGPIGTVVTLSGIHYIYSHALTATNIDGATPAISNSTASGAIAAAQSFAVESAEIGSQSITVSDGTNTATATFTVEDSLIRSPTHGKVGDTITLTGKGYHASDAITFTFDSIPITPSDAPITSDDDGAFVAHIVIPAATNGSKNVVATDAHAHSLTAAVVVDAAVLLSPTFGDALTVVTVTGTGFGGTEVITTKFNGVVMVTSPGVVTSDATGGFSCTFVIPDTTTDGDHIVNETDTDLNSVDSTFTTILPKTSINSTFNHLNGRNLNNTSIGAITGREIEAIVNVPFSASFKYETGGVRIDFSSARFIKVYLCLVITKTFKGYVTYIPDTQNDADDGKLKIFDVNGAEIASGDTSLAGESLVVKIRGA